MKNNQVKKKLNLEKIRVSKLKNLCLIKGGGIDGWETITESKHRDCDPGGVGADGED